MKMSQARQPKSNLPHIFFIGGGWMVWPMRPNIARSQNKWTGAIYFAKRKNREIKKLRENSK